MTTAQQTIHYQLSSASDLDRLLGEMETIRSGTVVVAFADTTRFNPTDVDLARLVAAARDHRKRLVIESGDRELVKRAMKMGFDDLAVVSDVLAHYLNDTRTIAPAIVPGDNTDSSDRGYDTTSSLATYRPANESVDWPESETDQGFPRDDREKAGETVLSERDTVVLPTDWSRSQQEIDDDIDEQDHVDDEGQQAICAAPASSRPRRQPVEVSADRDEHEEAWEEPVSRPRKRRNGRRRKGIVLAAAIVAPILVLAVVAAMIVYMLPTADVSITPTEERISSSLTYGVQTADASFDIAVDPTVVSNSSSAQATREATAERFEPDGTAGGTLQITNPFTSEVTVPGGTDIEGGNGVTYYTSQDVVIPAADPFGSLSFGSATVDIYAEIAGPDGNLDVGALTGQLGIGLFYTNPSDITGGTLRSIAVIDETDVAAVASDVETSLLEKAEREFLATVPEGMELVPGSVEIQEPEVEVDGEAGEDGESVSASGSISVRGQIFDPDELHERAREEAGRLLASQGGSERILLVSSVAIADPAALDNDGTSFSINADATVRTVISDEERHALVNELVGKSRADAEAILAEHPKVASYNLVVEPDWLPDRLPEIASRIELHVSTGEQTTATR